MGELRVNTWARIPDGCAIRTTVQDDTATFEFESGPDMFGFSAERSTIALLVDLATDALRRLDAEPPTVPSTPGSASV